LQQVGFFVKNSSIGEQIVSYFDRYSSEIFTRDKQIGFDYKN